MPSRTWKSRCWRTEYCRAAISFSDNSLAAESQRYRDGFERALQIGDGHSQLVDVVVTPGRGQVRAGQRGVRRQFDCHRLILQRGVLIEQLVDPNR